MNTNSELVFLHERRILTVDFLHGIQVYSYEKICFPFFGSPCIHDTIR